MYKKALLILCFLFVLMYLSFLNKPVTGLRVNEERFNELLPSDFITDDKYMDVDEEKIQNYSALFDDFVRDLELTSNRWTILTQNERSNIYDMIHYKDVLYTRLDNITSSDESTKSDCETFKKYCQRNTDNTLRALPINDYKAFTISDFENKLEKCYLLSCGEWDKLSLLKEISFVYDTFFEILRRNAIMYSTDDETIQFKYDAFNYTNTYYNDAREELALFLTMCRMKLRKFLLENQKHEHAKDEILHHFKTNNTLL